MVLNCDVPTPPQVTCTDYREMVHNYHIYHFCTDIRSCPLRSRKMSGLYHPWSRFYSAVALLLLLHFAGTAVATSSQCQAVPSYAISGLFLSDVEWSCDAPFNCLLEFCSCLSDELSTGCLTGSFAIQSIAGNITSSQLETCTSTLATCTLTAALASAGASNHSCRTWGTTLSNYYALAYTNGVSGSNLTYACEKDYCSVMQGVSSTIGDAVNVTRICSFLYFSWPEPLDAGELPQCAATKTTRTYFSDVPASQCSDAAICVRNFCSCVNGTLNTTSYQCATPSTLSANAGKQCMAIGMTCLLSAALNAYVPGASPLSPDPCIAWSVPFAEDYATYYAAANATLKRATTLYRSCNFTACQTIFGELDDDNFTAVCDLPATLQPTFQAYNPCPYTCPDSTCAYNLAGCACTANAVVSDVTTVMSQALATSNGTFDSSKIFTATAYGSYGVSSGNCSSYNFHSVLLFRWTLLTASSSIAIDINSTYLTIPAGSLTAGVAYTLRLRVAGLLSTQLVTHQWAFTATVPSPVISFRSGASMRVGSASNVTLTVSVVDYDVSISQYAWICTPSDTCPTLTAVTNASVRIPAGSAVGSYVITYVYRGQYNASVSVTIVSGEVPVVRVFTSTTALNLVPATYLSSQSVVLGSAVTFSSKNVTYAWQIGSNTTVIGTSSTLTLTSSLLTTTSISNAVAGNLVLNTIQLMVTSVLSSDVYGLATIEVAMLEPLSMTLSIAKQGGGSSAAALTDTLIFTPAVSGLAGSTNPFGATGAFAFYYTDNVSQTATNVAILTTPSGSSYTATAPMYSYSGASVSLTFTAVFTLNSIAAVSSTNTFTVTAPTDLTAAANTLVASLSVTTDPVLLADAVTKMRAVASASGNSTLMASIATATVASLSNITASQIPAAQLQGIMGALTTLLPSLTSAQLAASATSMQALMVASLASADMTTSLAVAGAAANLPAKNAALTFVSVSAALMNNVDLGSTVTVTATGLEIAASSASASSLAGSTFGSSGSCSASASLASGFALPGVSDTDVVSVGLTKSAASPYGTASPDGSTLTAEIRVNNQPYDVSGLQVPIVLTLGCDGGSGSCQFNSASSPTWAADGTVTTQVRSDGRIQCVTPHLTSFGTFQSSASARTLSLAVTAAILMFHILMTA